MDELNELEKYRMAKKYFSYDKLTRQATDENGIVDEQILKKSLEENLERMIEYAKSKLNNSEEYIKRLQDLFEIISDKKMMAYFERLEQQEKFIRNQKIDENELLQTYSMIAGTRMKRVQDGQTFSIKVSPKDENPKNVKITKIGTLEYKTAFNVYSDLQVYIVEKNIDGMDRKFVVATNTNFQLANNIMNKPEDLTEADKQYIQCVSEQLSDINLISTQRKLNGYTGTVICYKGKSELDFNPEEYCAYKKATEEKNEEKDR